MKTSVTYVDDEDGTEFGYRVEREDGTTDINFDTFHHNPDQEVRLQFSVVDARTLAYALLAAAEDRGS